ncbi:hypothetical protein JW823_06925 [bacterium]|nr:hypothetical protein [candidate division CSSED10-310 bacterium]
MKKIISIAGSILFCCAFAVIACEETQYIDGVTWTFHRMDDGNSFHELRKAGEFTEGDTLNLTAPCQGRHIDSIQIEWEDNHSDVRGEVVTMPGNRRLGVRDVSGKKRETWTVHQKTDRFRVEFSGKRGHRCRVKWIRVFYGVNAAPYNPKEQVQSAGDASYDLIDRLGLHDGKIQRKARAIRWNGSQIVIAVKTDNGQEILKLNPDEVKNLLFTERWGNAVDKDGGRFPVRVKKMNGGMIELDKNLNGNIVSKPPIDIHHYKSIEFK